MQTLILAAILLLLSTLAFQLGRKRADGSIQRVAHAHAPHPSAVADSAP